MSYSYDTDESDCESKLEKLAEKSSVALSKPVAESQQETSENEDEETEFRKFVERIRTPRATTVQASLSNSASSPGFSEKRKLIYSSEGVGGNDRISTNVTKSTQNTLQSQTVTSQHNTEHISTDNGRHHNERDTSSRISFVSVDLSSDSEDEETEFLKFSERIRQTPRLQKNIMHVSQSITNEPSDDMADDEVFLKFSEKFQLPYTPRSQNRNNARHSVVSNNFPQKQSSFHSSNKGSSNLISSDDKHLRNSLEAFQARNKEEFTALFPTVSETSESFCKKREKYAEQLFDFFNRKIFDSQLPKDMPLIWDNSLGKAAGLTSCSLKNNIYRCSIKLSTKLLTSFDRLQDTLLHEMCHAAVWVINNIGSVVHGPLWKIWGSRCKMILPFIECPERCHNYDVPYTILYQCLSCNWKLGRLRQSQKLAKKVCKKCKKPIIVTRA